MKKLTAPWPLFLILALILTINLARFAALDRIPYGYHVDEMCGAVTIQCLATEGVDARNHPFPLYSELDYGNPKPPTYIYPGILWGKFFGYSVPSFRAYSALAFVLGVVGLFFLGRVLFGPLYGVLAALLATISPWTWLLSRIGMESISCPTFLIWGLFFFLSKARWHHFVLSGFFFACAMYTYPATRLHVPLLLVTLIIFQWRAHTLNVKNLAIFLLTLAVLLFPMAQMILGGQLLDRFNNVSILNAQYLASVGKTNSLPDLAGIFLQNYFKHFQPGFWFWKGDPNAVYATQSFGQLSWLDAAGLFGGGVVLIGAFLKRPLPRAVLRQNRRLLLFLLANIFLGIVPAALTHNGLPHSLRIIGAWPFVTLLAAFFLWRASEKRPALLAVYCLVATVFSAAFLQNYFTSYPQKYKGMFLYWAKDESGRARTDEDWLNFMFRYRYQDFTCRYYLMNDRGESCTTARMNWEKMRQLAPLLESKQKPAVP